MAGSDPLLTKDSTKGQVILPKAIRRLRNWDAGTRLVVEDTPDGVLLKPAPDGTGIIAGGPMRAVFETLGVADVVTKSVGSSNPHNMVKATFAALQALNAPRQIANKRGKKVADILGCRGETEE